MSVRPSNLPPVQDIAPPGGFRKVDVARIFPTRGPKGWQLWAGSSVIIAYGFYQVGQTNIKKNQQKYLERKARYAVAPLLQAEADREYLERELINLKIEKETMKNVAGWEVGKNPYHSGVFMPRAVDPFDTSNK
jgi:NADH dehydrogenase (ubiquinone) 1 alpha subcomplex subunit 13|eukprot:38023_1